MFYYRQFDEDYFLKKLSESHDSEELLSAYNLLEEGNVIKGHELIASSSLKNCSLALVLASIYSNENEEESDFIKRHLDQLKEAANARDPFALYSLGVYHDVGELLEEDKMLAYKYFKDSAELDLPQAQYIYGTMLYYGTGGARLDVEKGLNYLYLSSKQGYEDATTLLQSLHK